MTTFVSALHFVTLAEMGDKTRLLAMAFATRFPARAVRAAVFTATLLNHALAVAATLAAAIGIVPDWPAAPKVKVSARSRGGIGQRW